MIGLLSPETQALAAETGVLAVPPVGLSSNPVRPLFTGKVMGMDPGISGAIAILDPTTSDVEIFDMPVAKTKGSKTQLLNAELARFMDEKSPTIARAFIEHVSSHKGEGHAGAFTFGRMFEALIQATACNFLPYQLVTPAVWKKEFKLSSDKEMSRALVIRMFPRFAGLFARKMDEGRAEALLIAVWGAREMARNGGAL